MLTKRLANHQLPLIVCVTSRRGTAGRGSRAGRSRRPIHSPALNGQRNWRSQGDRARLPGQTVLGGRVISEWFWLQRQAEVSNRLPVKKNDRFLTF